MTTTDIKELRQAPAMLPLFAKAVLRAGVKPGKEPQLPDIAASLRDVMIDPKHLQRYREVCGFSDTEVLPVTYPHLHAHPLFMTLLLDSRFPFAAMGLVHVANRITRFRPIKAREQLDVQSGFGKLKKTDKGYEFSIITTVSTAGEPVWESESTMLCRTGGGSKKSSKDTPSTEPATPTEIWQVPGNIGRRYGAVSGDRNPIHLYPLSARLFGFKRQIAHGMWSKARCLAALEQALPQSPFTVDVQFKLPMFIPAKVHFVREETDQGVAFRLLGEDRIKPHLTGLITASD